MSSMPVSNSSNSPVTASADVSPTQPPSAEEVMQHLIDNIQSQIPGMYNSLNQEINNLKVSIAFHKLEYQNAVNGGEDEKATNLADIIEQETDEMTGKMRDVNTLASIGNRLGDTDPSNDAAAVSDFVTYQSHLGSSGDQMR